MNTFRLFVASLVLAIVASSCSSSGSSNATNQTPASVTAASPTSVNTNNWYNYTSETGEYTAKFPGKPREDTQTLDTKAGKTNLVLVTYEDKPAKRAYAISHNKFMMPSGTTFNLEKGLDGSRDGLARGMGAKVTQEKKIERYGLAGREIMMNKDNSLAARARIFYSDGILYQIFVLAEGDGKNLEASEVTAFLDSVELKK